MSTSSDTTLHALRMMKTLSDGYGLTKEAATWSVVTWCYMLGLTDIADIIAESIEFAANTESNPQDVSPIIPQRQKLLGNVMYLAGKECPYGNVKLESLDDNLTWWKLYKAGSNSVSDIKYFKKQAYITIPEGMLFQTDHDVYISQL